MQLVFNPKPVTRDKVVVDKYGETLEEDDLILISSVSFFKNEQHLYVVKEPDKGISKDRNQKNVDLRYIDSQRITKLGIKDE